MLISYTDTCIHAFREKDSTVCCTCYLMLCQATKLTIIVMDNVVRLKSVENKSSTWYCNVTCIQDT